MSSPSSSRLLHLTFPFLAKIFIFTWNFMDLWKVAGAQGWQPYHLHVLIVLKYGSLNLLEPSGPVQACNGIALPLFQIKRCVLITNTHRSLLLTQTAAAHCESNAIPPTHRDSRTQSCSLAKQLSHTSSVLNGSTGRTEPPFTNMFLYNHARLCPKYDLRRAALSPAAHVVTPI